MNTDDARRALGNLVRRKRQALGRTIDRMAADSKVSPVTWSRVEHGLTVRGLTYGAVDRTFGWPAGACQRYLDEGVEPEPIREEPVRPAPPPVVEIGATVNRRAGGDYRVLDVTWPSSPNRRMTVLWEGPLLRTPTEVTEVQRELADFCFDPRGR